MYRMYEFKYMCMLMNRSVMHNENTKNTIVSTSGQNGNLNRCLLYNN